MKTPIPHDIPLPLPAGEVFLNVLLVVSFIAHILFVNLMVGGSLFTLYYQWKSKQKDLYDDLAQFNAQTITVNKSMAVVLGVAPLLLINVLYTVWFYSSNALTGIAWIMVIPLVGIAFLLTYLHKYTWEKWRGKKTLHMSIMGVAVLIFLFIPLVFLANVNLMLFPDRWAEAKGFFSTLLIGNVFPRYFHFLAASIAVTALFLVWMLKTKWIESYGQLVNHKSKLAQEFYKIALGISLAQFFFGPLLLFTLPKVGLSVSLYSVIGLGVVFASLTMYLMSQEIKTITETHFAKRILPISILMTATVFCMASGRHLYRENALASHKEAVRQKTEAYQVKVKEAFLAASEVEALAGDGNRGQKLFQSCAGCHSKDTRLVGPPLTEIVKIYEGNAAGIVSWAKAPGKKRADYPQMPPMSLPDEDLKAIADYILNLNY